MFLISADEGGIFLCVYIAAAGPQAGWQLSLIPIHFQFPPTTPSYDDLKQKITQMKIRRLDQATPLCLYIYIYVDE